MVTHGGIEFVTKTFEMNAKSMVSENQTKNYWKEWNDHEGRGGKTRLIKEARDPTWLRLKGRRYERKSAALRQETQWKRIR